MIAPPLIVVFIVIAAILTPGYSHISETVSQLGAQGRPHPEVMSAGFVVYGLVINGFAYALYLQLGKTRTITLAGLSLVIYGTGVLLTGIFQDGPNLPYIEPNLESALHSLFAMIGFFGLVVGMLIFARAVYRKPEWRFFTPISLLAAVLNLGSSLLFLMENLGSIEGLLQRVFYAVSLCWIELVVLRIYRLSSVRNSQELDHPR